MRNVHYVSLWIIAPLLIGCAAMAAPAGGHDRQAGGASEGSVSVVDHLPQGYVTDGSVVYLEAIQKAIDAAHSRGVGVVFPPMIYGVDESGLHVRSGMTLWMDGAVFQVVDDCEQDGQVFIAADVERVCFHGGEIRGAVDSWPRGVNVRGVAVTGQSRDIRVENMRIRDLSSNGVGVHGDGEGRAADVWIEDTVISNCGAYYGDYSDKDSGREAGSDRADQGLIALYHVDGFVVRGCRLDDARSDATHFYRCTEGQFSGNRIHTAKMGGLFFETCEDAVSSDNVIVDCGSRGVTIERGSVRCTLTGNVVRGSGREGLWAPNCKSIVVAANVFDRNGRKPNGTSARSVWNANVTINSAGGDPTNTTAQDYVLTGNILRTDKSQVAAVRIDADQVDGVYVHGNLLRGPNRRIQIDGDATESVVAYENDGAF